MIAVGVGARSGAGRVLLAGAVDAALAEAGVERARVSVVATLDRRAGETGVRLLAESCGWRLVAFSADELAVVAGAGLVTPSVRVAAAVGTPSVAEAAALLAAGAGASLILPKRILDGVTVAIAESAPR